MKTVAEMFMANMIIDGDVFLITDAWNPCVHQLRYMAELTGKDIRIVGIWHAGSYDEWDILGQVFRQNDRLDWARNLEAAMQQAYDLNIFATEFHKTLFEEEVYHECHDTERNVVVGFPMEYMLQRPEFKITARKRDMVIFPHRASPEKQHEIAEDLAIELAKHDIEMYICQGKGLSPEEYHQKLAEAKVIFSASHQETLGIAQFEGMLHGALPLCPSRLSYNEMYDEEFLYPSPWTIDYDSYLENKGKIVRRIVEMVKEYNDYAVNLNENRNRIMRDFFTGTELYARTLGIQ